MPSAPNSRNCSSYASPVLIAFWKIVGLDVAPTTASASISSCRCPPRIDSRERKSTHTLCPNAERRCRGERV
jgi:hypothetical protein